ncbi:hypothetical protein JCM11491_000713 [Sporobolomyces phaffii]
MKSTDEEKRAFARQSHAWNAQQPKFKSMFPEYAGPEMRDVPNMVRSRNEDARRRDDEGKDLSTGGRARPERPNEERHGETSKISRFGFLLAAVVAAVAATLVGVAIARSIAS